MSLIEKKKKEKTSNDMSCLFDRQQIHKLWGIGTRSES